MSGSGDNEDAVRRVRTMQDLLRFCVQGTLSEDAPSNPPLDPERKIWLENAIKAFTVDIIQEMLEAIANIKKQLEQLGTTDAQFNRRQSDIIESIEGSVDIVRDRIEDLDIAADFEKIGGFSILCPLLQSPHPELQIKGAELVGELVQNVDHLQTTAIKHGVLEHLVKILDAPSNGSVQAKALFGVSCLIRGNLNNAEDIFVEQLDGFSVLLRAMQSTSADGPRLRTKASFLLSAIIGGRQDFKETLFKMGFIDQIVGLLHQEWETSHEHLLASLLNFITDFQPALEDCCSRRDLRLRSLLTDKLLTLAGKPEFQEEERYCKSILDLLEGPELANVALNSPNDNNYSMDR